ncbi:MAG: phasin family protein [Salinarimonas sp.]
MKSDAAASAGKTVKADTGQAPGKAPKAVPAPVAAAPGEPAASFKFTPKFAPVKSEPAGAEAAPAALGFDLLPGGDAVAKPLRMALDLSTQSARDGYVRARESQDALQKACASSVDAASRGLVALNAQWIDLMRMQSDTTLGLWRATITAPSLSEAVKAQTSGMRQAYDSTASQLKAIAETGTRVASETTEPLRKAFPGA